VIDHQSAVLYDFNPRFGENLGGGIVADTRLKPD
jgi:hypothetical protein